MYTYMKVVGIDSYVCPLMTIKIRVKVFRELKCNLWGWDFPGSRVSPDPYIYCTCTCICI
jgi:hypothetical protein